MAVTEPEEKKTGIIKWGLRHFAEGLSRFVIRQQYEYLSNMDKDATLVFLNYGYSDGAQTGNTRELAGARESDRYSVQLYDHVASGVELTGKDVLEVGCGRGGGAAYVMRKFAPRTMVGLDFCKRAVEFCQWHYDQEGLEYVRGDAEKLRFEDCSFDAVINIESSHCYRRLDRFLAGVYRILRPGGFLLLSDFRAAANMDSFRQAFSASGLECIRDEDITSNVLEALDLDAERKTALIERKVPERRRESFRIFAGLPGTPVHDAMQNGRMEYRNFVLKKPGQELLEEATSGGRS